MDASPQTIHGLQRQDASPEFPQKGQHLSQSLNWESPSLLPGIPPPHSPCSSGSVTADGFRDPFPSTFGQFADPVQLGFALHWHPLQGGQIQHHAAPDVIVIIVTAVKVVVEKLGVERDGQCWAFPPASDLSLPQPKCPLDSPPAHHSTSSSGPQWGLAGSGRSRTSAAHGALAPTPCGEPGGQVSTQPPSNQRGSYLYTNIYL